MNAIDRFLAESTDVDTSIEKNGRRQSVKVFVVNADHKILYLRIQEGCGGAGK